ncbi:MAG TPA: hypothetical protein VH500_08440 [Nitrososphaeraceae archaeon]
MKLLHGQMLSCRYCNNEITFSDQKVSKNGKKIPLDPETFNIHQCKQSSKVWSREHHLLCRSCKTTLIYFDDRFISDSGKKVPLDKTTNKPHNCLENLYNKTKTKYRN